MQRGSDAILSMRSISFSYGRTVVFEDVSMNLHRGEIAFLKGSNGAGKSTLLRCAAGWSAPSAGAIEVLGRPLCSADRQLRRELILITDAPPFYDDLTGLEHLRFFMRANHMSDKDDETRRLLDVFGLTDVAEAYPSTYSRGMRYKLALVLALLVGPSLLLLDEPFGPIDTESARTLWVELRALVAAGSAVLATVHGLPTAVPDSCYTLENGSILESTPCGDVTA